MIKDNIEKELTYLINEKIYVIVLLNKYSNLEVKDPISNLVLTNIKPYLINFFKEVLIDNNMEIDALNRILSSIDNIKDEKLLSDSLINYINLILEYFNKLNESRKDELSDVLEITNISVEDKIYSNDYKYLLVLENKLDKDNYQRIINIFHKQK